MADERGVALVTGANRGIGLELVRQLAREGFLGLLGSRDPDKGEAAAAALRDDGLRVEARPLDVADPASVAALGRALADKPGRLDVLVNNAAIHYDTWQRGVEADLDVVREALETNLLGAWRTAQACLPLLRRSPQGRLVNVSSGAGSLAGMGAGTPALGGSARRRRPDGRLLPRRPAGRLVNEEGPAYAGRPSTSTTMSSCKKQMWPATLSTASKGCS